MMLQKIVLINIMVLVLLLGCTCKKIATEDDKLSLLKTPYTGNQLKINGYYYNKWGDPESMTIYFLYSNGVILHGDDPYLSRISEYEKKYSNGEFYNYAKDYKISWGVFQIDGDKIAFERWYPSSGGPTHAYVRAGKILNDTTFQITESYRMQGGNKTEVSVKDEVYHFKKFSPKPDSVNVFVP